MDFLLNTNEVESLNSKVKNRCNDELYNDVTKKLYEAYELLNSFYSNNELNSKFNSFISEIPNFCNSYQEIGNEITSFISEIESADSTSQVRYYINENIVQDYGSMQVT